MKLVSIKLATQFNSLEPFDKKSFEHLDNEEGKIDPICLIGVNGSGKSNLLELLTEAFFHLELNHRFEKDKSSKKRINKKLEIVYYLKAKDAVVRIESFTSNYVKLYIENKTATSEKDKWAEIKNSDEILEYLPNKIVGYTSGMNETLSFRFNQLDEEYSEDVLVNARSKSDDRIPDNRMIFLDYESNEAIVVSNFLFKDKKALKVFDEELRINGLSSFKIVINLRRKNKSKKDLVILSKELEDNLQKLQNCSTCWKVKQDEGYYEFDYLVNEATIDAFRHHFVSLYELFMVFQKFELLNPINLDKKFRKTKNGEDIIESKPILAKEDRVFRFEEIQLTISKPQKEIQYISISDGEHQFMQIIGAFMIFDQDDVLFLLDEPETHFNPTWRTKFIRIINQYTKDRDQEIALTTHSPFIVSDCKDYRVYKFKRIGDKCSFDEIGIETYGTSFDIILKKAFDIEDTISEEAKNEIDKLLKSNSEKKIQKFIDNSGPSFEKLALLRHLKDINPKS